MSRRSSSSGRSMKKISSKRPLRSSSGGVAERSLAVAATNTLAFFSESQVRNAPNSRRDNPASASAAPLPANAFSISSIHSTTGDTASAAANASRSFFSDSPTYLSNRRPGSRRTSGSPHSRATVLAARLLPHP